MKSTLSNLLIVLSLVFCSCEKEEETTTKESSSSSSSHSTTASLVKLNVVNLDSEAQPGVEVIMSSDPITDTTTFNQVTSEITESDGMATFEMEEYIFQEPETYYYGVLRDLGDNTYELRGSVKVDGIKKDVERTVTLLLYK